MQCGDLVIVFGVLINVDVPLIHRRFFMLFKSSGLLTVLPCICLVSAVSCRSMLCWCASVNYMIKEILHNHNLKLMMSCSPNCLQTVLSALCQEHTKSISIVITEKMMFTVCSGSDKCYNGQVIKRQIENIHGHIYF